MEVFPFELKILLSPMQGVLYSALTCRIIINMRIVALRPCDALTESCADLQDTDSSIIPTFRPSESLDWTPSNEGDSYLGIPLSPV